MNNLTLWQFTLDNLRDDLTLAANLSRENVRCSEAQYGLLNDIADRVMALVDEMKEKKD